jgi:hypothetical protein
LPAPKNLQHPAHGQSLPVPSLLWLSVGVLAAAAVVVVVGRQVHREMVLAAAAAVRMPTAYLKPQTLAQPKPLLLVQVALAVQRGLLLVRQTQAAMAGTHRLGRSLFRMAAGALRVNLAGKAGVFYPLVTSQQLPDNQYLLLKP